MALHLHDTDDDPRIAWVCAKHSLLFYAGDPAVASWMHGTAEPAAREGSAAVLGDRA